MAGKKPTHVVIRAHYSRINGKLAEVPVGQTFTFSKEQAEKLNPKFFAPYEEGVANIDAAPDDKSGAVPPAPPSEGADGKGGLLNKFTGKQ